MQTQKVTTVTGTYTATYSDNVILCDATSAGFTVTLPSITGQKFLTIKKVDSTANNVTIASADLMDGESSLIIFLPYTSLDLVSNGTTWSIV